MWAIHKIIGLMKWLLLISAKKRKETCENGSELINVSIEGRKQDVEPIRMTAGGRSGGGSRGTNRTHDHTRNAALSLRVTNAAVMFASDRRFASSRVSLMMTFSIVNIKMLFIYCVLSFI